MSAMVESPFCRLHPVVKVYAFLFVLLFACLVPSTSILLVSSTLVFVILLASKLPLRLIWNTTKVFALLLIPFILLLTLLEYPDARALPLAGLTYLRFVNLLVIGAIFGLTTNPIDIPLFCLQFRSVNVRRVGFALAAAGSSLAVLRQKATDTVVLQQLRGARYSLNPLKIRATARFIRYALVSIILQTIQLSSDYAVAMVARGFTSDRVTVPTYFSLRKPSNSLLLLSATCYLIFVLMKGWG